MAEAKKKGRRRLLVGVSMLLWLVAADVVWVQWNRRITVGNDTTRITLPLVEGYPDYLGALNEAGAADVTPENNAAGLLFDIVGSEAADLNPRYGKELLAGMGKMYTEARPTFVEYAAWARSRGAPGAPAGTAIDEMGSDELLALNGDDPSGGELELCRGEPWKAAEHPEVAAWIEEMKPSLEKLELACARPGFYWPVVAVDGRSHGLADSAAGIVLPPLGRMRALAEAAVIRANERLAGGDWVGYQLDVFMALRLARLLGQHADYLQYLTAVAVDDRASESVQRAASSPLLTARAADELRRGLESLPAMASPAEVVDVEHRLAMLSNLCVFLQTSSKQVVCSFIPVNYNAALRKLNEELDQGVQVFGLPTAPDRMDAIEMFAARYQSSWDQSGAYHKMTHLEEPIMTIAAGGIARLLRRQTTNMVNRDLALTALALRTARGNGSAFPEKLSELKGFAVPADRFVEKPLVYRRVGEGYVLYSVGPDLADDGGVPRAKIGGTLKSWDMVVKAEK